ncbi:MAG: cupredoxin domain-containing protein [Thermoanaerobaculia bacterium]
MRNPLPMLSALVCGALFVAAGRVSAADATVNISDYMFTDTASGNSTSTISVGDSVTWNWPADSHSTTSGVCTGGGGYYGDSTCTPDGNWDSAVNSSPHAFTHQFTAAGTYHYFCQVHLSMMTGVVVVKAVEQTVCTPSSTVLCIDDQAGDKRFEVEATFQTSQGGGSSGSGQAIPLTSLGVTHGGLFWFFSADNPELLVKVLNTCSFSNHIWVFASAGTNVGVTLTVTDTRTGDQRVYTNADLHIMDPIQDTSALSSCP